MFLEPTAMVLALNLTFRHPQRPSQQLGYEPSTTPREWPATLGRRGSPSKSTRLDLDIFLQETQLRLRPGRTQSWNVPRANNSCVDCRRALSSSVGTIVVNLRSMRQM